MPLTDSLIKTGFLKTPAIIEAFKKIDRANFLPTDLKSLAQINRALPIGWSQTMSQPLVVAFMLEQLKPKSGDIILDIGFGSGWTTALLAEIVGEKGKVVAVEIVDELYQFGKKNVWRLGYRQVEFRSGGWQKQVKLSEKFDRIQAACAFPSVPVRLKNQLADGGRMILPVNDGRGSQSLREIWRVGGDFQKKDYPGFIFVPMTNEDKYPKRP